MPQTQTRREFLLAASAAATLHMPTAATAQERSIVGKPALEYRTAEALLAALTAREISAVELTKHAIARIESRFPHQRSGRARLRARGVRRRRGR